MVKAVNFMLGLLFAAECFGDALSLPSIFSDHMVLQQAQSVPVWGRAENGSTVTVEFAGQKKETVAGDNGKWQVTLDPLTASSKPEKMIVHSSSDSCSLTLSGILVGEVWLCSGQSNMEWPLNKAENSGLELVSADHSEIRLFKIPRTLSATPCEDIEAQWTVCSPESAASFSGVAYYFGKKIQQDLNVPVGLIMSAWGGTGIAGWVAPEGFDLVDALSNVRGASRSPRLTGDEKKDRQLPSVLYNGMIAPCTPFAMRGVIWYQGEANRRMGERYVDFSKALVGGWRQLWEADFSFYFVQIAPYSYEGDAPGTLPVFWEAQAEITQEICGAEMAIIHDYATVDQIHPPNKEIPGTRLALLAEEHTYGLNVISSGPVFQALEKQKGCLRVSFDFADGLTTRDGKEPDWFEVAGPGGVFKPARAEIKGNSVMLRAADVANPVAVRLGWHDLAKPNLVNGAGLPARSFRAGKIMRAE